MRFRWNCKKNEKEREEIGMEMTNFGSGMDDFSLSMGDDFGGDDFGSGGFGGDGFAGGFEGGTPSAQGGVRTILNKLMGSRLMLVLAILMSIQLVSVLALGIIALVNLADVGSARVLMFPIITLLVIVGIMAVKRVGVWLIYKNGADNGSSTVGFTMNRIVTIIQMVFTCLTLLGSLALIVMAMVSLRSALDDFGSVGTPFFLLLILTVVGSGVVVVLYYLKHISNLNGMKTVIASDTVKQFSLYPSVYWLLMVLSTNLGIAVTGLFGLVTAGTFSSLMDGLSELADSFGTDFSFEVDAVSSGSALFIIVMLLFFIYGAVSIAVEIMKSLVFIKAWGEMKVAAAPEKIVEKVKVVEKRVEVRVPASTVSNGGGFVVQPALGIRVEMIRERTNEIIKISKPLFLIGKESGKVDYKITNNNKISRVHAKIKVNGNRCFIQDNMSLNHVRVNGKLLSSGAEMEIRNGDKVVLADETFVVQILGGK